MRKLKILIITWHYAPQVGGVETVSGIIAKSLTKDGHDVTVLTSSTKKEELVLDGCKVIRTPLLFEKNEKFREYFFGLLNLNNFDIVHAHNISHPFNPGVSMDIINECNRAGLPIIEHAHNAQLRTPEKTRKIILSNLSKIICVSDFVKKRFISLGVSDKKLITISNPLSKDLFNPEKIKGKDIFEMRGEIGVSDEIVIFFPARVIRMSKLEIGEQKQFKTLIEALTIVKKNGFKFKLIFAGMKNLPNASPDYIRNGEKLINNFLASKDLSDDVFIFENGLQLTDMPLAYAASDIVCMPSLNETFGMVFLEAQAMGKPVVAARSGAAPYIIENHKTGIVVPEKNSKELAKALISLIENEDKRITMGNAGKKMVSEEFSPENILEKIKEVYSSFV